MPMCQQVRANLLKSLIWSINFRQLRCIFCILSAVICGGLVATSLIHSLAQPVYAPMLGVACLILSISFVVIAYRHFGQRLSK